MQINALPKEWLPARGNKTTEPLVCRFDEETAKAIRTLAEIHSLSVAQIVRILVAHSLAESVRPNAA